MHTKVSHTKVHTNVFQLCILTIVAVQLYHEMFVSVSVVLCKVKYVVSKS